MVGVSMNAWADDDNKIRLIKNGGATNNPKGITIQPSCVFYVEQGDSCLQLTAENYNGFIGILLMKNLEHMVVYDEYEYINSSEPVIIDTSSFQTGTYTVYVFVEDEIFSNEIYLE